MPPRDARRQAATRGGPTGIGGPSRGAMRMTNVFPRGPMSKPIAATAEGCWITDAGGKRYLDGGGGALVVNIGHGDRDVVRAMTKQAARVAYVHGTQLTTEAVEA